MQGRAYSLPPIDDLMDLFEHLHDPTNNLLPYEGEVYYHGLVMSSKEADHYLHLLLNSLDWQPDQAKIMGKVITTRRRIAWYGSQPFSYTYSGITKTAWPWTDALLQLKQMVEACTDVNYNSCLVNLYHDGQDGMAYHSDGEMDLLHHGTIASLTLGAERRFVFKHKRRQDKVELILAHGSLLTMAGSTQDNWLHRLPQVAGVTQPRVNLTFRTIVSNKGLA